MSTVRLELPYQCISQAKSRVETLWRGTQCSDVERDAAMWRHGYNMLVSRFRCILWCTMQITNHAIYIDVSKAINHPWWLSMLFH